MRILGKKGEVRFCGAAGCLHKPDTIFVNIHSTHSERTKDLTLCEKHTPSWVVNKNPMQNYFTNAAILELVEIRK